MNSMTKITYKQAAEILDVKYVTVRNAAMNGLLSKVQNMALLIKEQVLLFKGKSRISFNSLSVEEMEKWQEYDKMALSGDTASNNTTEFAREVASHIVQMSPILSQPLYDETTQELIETAKHLNHLIDAIQKKNQKLDQINHVFHSLRV